MRHLSGGARPSCSLVALEGGAALRGGLPARAGRFSSDLDFSLPPSMTTPLRSGDSSMRSTALTSVHSPTASIVWSVAGTRSPTKTRSLGPNPAGQLHRRSTLGPPPWLVRRPEHSYIVEHCPSPLVDAYRWIAAGASVDLIQNVSARRLPTSTGAALPATWAPDYLVGGPAPGIRA